MYLTKLMFQCPCSLCVHVAGQNGQCALRQEFKKDLQEKGRELGQINSYEVDMYIDELEVPLEEANINLDHKYVYTLE